MSAALAQIQAVMGAAEEAVSVVVLEAAGTSREAVVDHRKIKDVIGGQPTFVGFIRKLDVAAVARKDNKGAANKHEMPAHFQPNIKGPVVLFRTGADGDMSVPLPVTVAEYEAWVKAGGAAEEEPEEGSDGEEGEEGEEEEGDEEESEDEGEEQDLEAVREQLGELEKSSLKAMLDDMGLPSGGGVRLARRCPSERMQARVRLRPPLPVSDSPSACVRRRNLL